MIAADQLDRRASMGDRNYEDLPCVFTDEMVNDLYTRDFVDFRGSIDETPYYPFIRNETTYLCRITLPHHFPMEMLLEVFKKMGLRYVIISKGGKLLGLITKKDILRQLRHSNQPE